MPFPDSGCGCGNSSQDRIRKRYLLIMSQGKAKLHTVKKWRKLFLNHYNRKSPQVQNGRKLFKFPIANVKTGQNTK